MHCYLLDLPAELQLNIIDELLQAETIKTHHRHGYSHGEKQDEPICIYHDLINWSCTCSYFRNLLAPDIFKTARLVNDEKSGSSLKAVAKSPHSVHVKSLHFIGSTDAARFLDTEGILPHSVNTLICDLQRFPNLEKLSICFDNFEGYDEWFSEEFIGEEETPEQVLEAEASYAWRALMSRTYFALTKNKSPRFKHLEIRQLTWKNVSTYSNTAFQEFLGHFEQFTLSIYGDETYVGFQEWASRSNGHKEYSALMGKLDKYFFSQLAKVTNFSIKAPEEGPLGRLEKTKYYAPLALKADQVPLLKILHLDYIFVCPELIDFLVGHKYTLEELTLRNCSAPIGARDVSWSQLFTSLFSANPAQLRRFELVGHKIPLIRSERLEGEENELEVPDKVREARTILQQDPRRRLFAYTFPNNRTGEFLYDEKKILASFWLGQDQESWDRLIGLVEENNNKNAKSRPGVLNS